MFNHLYAEFDVCLYFLLFPQHQAIELTQQGVCWIENGKLLKGRLIGKLKVTLGFDFLTVTSGMMGCNVCCGQRQFNSFPSMDSYMKPISNLYFAGENHCVLTFARLFYKCKDEYFIY